MNAELITLASTELAEKAECEQQIADGIETFHKVGEALARIKEKGLYRDEFPTFAEYCAAKWQFTARRAYQLIDAAEVVNRCEQIVHIPNEAVARELAKLTPAEQRKAARMLKKSGNVTGGNAHKTAAKIKGRTVEPPVIDVSEPQLMPAQVAKQITDWWEENRRNLESIPPAVPGVVVRRIIALFT